MKRRDFVFRVFGLFSFGLVGVRLAKSLFSTVPEHTGTILRCYPKGVLPVISSSFLVLTETYLPKKMSLEEFNRRCSEWENQQALEALRDESIRSGRLVFEKHEFSPTVSRWEQHFRSEKDYLSWLEDVERLRIYDERRLAESGFTYSISFINKTS